MSRGKYKVVSFGTIAPLIGALIGIALLVFFCMKGFPEDTGGSIVSILTVITFIGGCFSVSLAILKKRLSFAKIIIGQDKHVLYASKEEKTREEQKELVKHLIKDRTISHVFESLQRYIRKTEIPKGFQIKEEFQKNTNREFNELHQITVLYQEEEPMYNWGAIHKPVKGLAKGMFATISTDRRTETEILSLTIHEIGHILLEFVFHITGEMKQYHIIRKSKIEQHSPFKNRSRNWII